MFRGESSPGREVFSRVRKFTFRKNLNATTRRRSFGQRPILALAMIDRKDAKEVPGRARELIVELRIVAPSGLHGFLRELTGLVAVSQASLDVPKTADQAPFCREHRIGPQHHA